MKKVIGLFVAILACSTVQSENYYAASVTKFDADAGGTSIDLTGITGTYGTDLSDSMSGELRFGFGVDDDSFIDDYGDYIESELDHYFGGYLKFSSTSGQIRPYATLGLTKIKVSVYDSYYGYSESASEDDFSYGLGVDFANGFNIEYMQYLDKGGLELNGLSLGMKF
jgi:hypothetical protein